MSKTPIDSQIYSVQENVAQTKVLPLIRWEKAGIISPTRSCVRATSPAERAVRMMDRDREVKVVALGEYQYFLTRVQWC